MLKVPPGKTQDSKKVKNNEKGNGFKKPMLDRFIRPEKERLYMTYAQAASYFSLSYYAMMRLVKDAGANVHIGKGVLVDMEKLNDYMENELRIKGE